MVNLSLQCIHTQLLPKVLQILNYYKLSEYLTITLHQICYPVWLVAQQTQVCAPQSHIQICCGPANKCWWASTLNFSAITTAIAFVIHQQCCQQCEQLLFSFLHLYSSRQCIQRRGNHIIYKYINLNWVIGWFCVHSLQALYSLNRHGHTTVLASFPGPCPASCHLQYGTASDGNLGEGLRMRLQLYSNKILCYDFILQTRIAVYVRAIQFLYLDIANA